MARKPTEFAQFKLRIRESLRRKIEREAEKKETSANAEAVERLEESFKLEQRIAEFREDMLGRVAESRAAAEASKAEAERIRDEILNIQRQAEALTAKHRDELNVLQKEVEKLEISAAMVDVLLGDNVASRDLVRKIALDLAMHPEWNTNETDRKAVAEKIYAFIYPPNHALENDPRKEG